jgi:hypothetical protein
MYGGIEDAPAGGKIAPTGDIYSMKLHLSKYSMSYTAHREASTNLARLQNRFQILNFLRKAGDFEFLNTFC